MEERKMSWKETSVMEQRKEYAMLAAQEGANINELCQRYGISRKTGYKRIKRHSDGGEGWQKDRSRRPHRSPNMISEEMEKEILRVRNAHSEWGGRKTLKVLESTLFASTAIKSPS